MSNLEQLEELVKTKLKEVLLIVVSNRGPYLIGEEGTKGTTLGKAKGVRPPSGLVTALDPVMRILGGVWVASCPLTPAPSPPGRGERVRGLEEAAYPVRLPVPSEDPRYTLRQVFLSKEEQDGFYYGFANEMLWPLCHIVHVRPTFRCSDWEQYLTVNRLFAEAVLEEIRDREAIVWSQDFHLSLLPRLLKDKRPDLLVGHFWHIPWPNPEAFRICPWKKELLEGLLGADLLGFHIRYHCDNFLKTVAMELEAKVIEEISAVQYQNHTTFVKPFPISIDYQGIQRELQGPEVQAEMGRIQKFFRRPPEFLAVGVDRIDYTKGIEERLQAIERFLEKYPEYQGRFVYLGVGSPSRVRLKAYQRLRQGILDLVERVNRRFRSEGWQPIVFLNEHVSYPRILAYYAVADLALVSSLHDGMNLVAKEFIAAQPDDDPGVLILSCFTGSARELHEALLINPYDREEFADALKKGLEMPKEERTRRMRWLKAWIEEHNIYRWAFSFLKEMAHLRRG